MELKEIGIKKVYDVEYDYIIYDNENDIEETKLHYTIMFDVFTMPFSEYSSDDIGILIMNNMQPNELIERCELTYEDIENIKDDIAEYLNKHLGVSDLSYRYECYENNGLICPYCKSNDVHSYKEIPGLWEIHDIMSCGACEKEFAYVYELTNIIKED